MGQIKEIHSQKPAPTAPPTRSLNDKMAARSRSAAGGAGTTQQEKRNEPTTANRQKSGTSVEETPDFSIGISG